MPSSWLRGETRVAEDRLSRIPSYELILGQTISTAAMMLADKFINEGNINLKNQLTAIPLEVLEFE